jgi:molybdopterin adenylyltransferase
MGLEQHRSVAPQRVSVYVVTLSDTRDASADTSGQWIRDTLQAAGHRIAGSCILREDAQSLESGLAQILVQPGFDVVIVNGGTGIAPRDRAPDVLARLYDRVLPGFGELFRALSYAEIGSAAMLSRASAGIARGKIVLSVPGSRAAVRLALDKLILPEIGHLVGELRRPAEPERAP